MLDTVVISGDDVCCSVVLGTLGLCLVLRAHYITHGQLGSGVNRVHVVLSQFSVRLFCFVLKNPYVGMIACMSWLHLC